MILYCVNVSLGDSWRNIWCGTKEEAIEAASEGDTVVQVCTKSDKSSGIELMNNSGMHCSNFHELDGVVTVLKVWPKELRR